MYYPSVHKAFHRQPLHLSLNANSYKLLQTSCSCALALKIKGIDFSRDTSVVWSWKTSLFKKKKKDLLVFINWITHIKYNELKLQDIGSWSMCRVSIVSPVRHNGAVSKMWCPFSILTSWPLFFETSLFPCYNKCFGTSELDAG